MEADINFELIEKEALARLEASPLKHFQETKSLPAAGGRVGEFKETSLENFNKFENCKAIITEKLCTCIITVNSYVLDPTCKTHAMFKSSL